jgi:hypothetical protein
MSIVVFGRTYPAMERAGASSNFADACAFDDVIAKKSTVVPQAQIGWLVVECRGRPCVELPILEAVV